MKTPQEKKSSKNSRYVSLSAHSPCFIVNSFQFLTIKIQKKPQTKVFGLSLLKISIKVFFFFVLQCCKEQEMYSRMRT
jgi:hypothetical protein